MDGETSEGAHVVKAYAVVILRCYIALVRKKEVEREFDEAERERVCE